MSSSGNDAAGNGMADGFRSAFVEGGAYLLGVLTVSFLLLRHSGVRIALLVALCLSTIFSLMLLQ